MKILDQSKKSAFENSVDGLFKSSDNYISNFMLKNDGSIPEQFEFECNKNGCKLTNESKEKLNGYKLDGLEGLAFKGKSPKSGNIKVTENGKTIYVDSITDGTWCATGYIDNLTISSDCKRVEEPIPDEDDKPSGEIIDPTAPDVAPEFSATATTNSITVRITKEADDSDSGIYGYQFSNDGGNTWKPPVPQTSQTEIVYTFYGVASGFYNVNVRAVNNTYKNNRIIDETNKIEGTMQTISTNSLGSVTEANATPSGFAQSKNVLVNFEGSGVYLIQPTVDAVANIDALLCTSVDAKYSCTDTMITAGGTLTIGENVWYKVESDPTLTFTNNGILRYKVIDGTNMTEVGSTNLDGIDVDAPDTSTFTVTGKTANSITVKASATDSESGIYGYQFSKDGGSTWYPSAPQTSATYTFSGLTAGTYTIKIKAINNTYKNNGINSLNTLESNIDSASNITITTMTTTRPTYTLSYNVNGGSGSISSQTALSGSSVTITNSIPTRSGYNFLGWSTSSIATSASYISSDELTLTSNVTLYAVWKVPMGYTIETATDKTYKAILYLDPTDLNKNCNASNSIVGVTGIKEGCMKWYAYAETATTYDLILDHNTTAQVAGSMASIQVSTDTENWDESLNARLITANEIAKITGHPTFNSATTTTPNMFYFDSNDQTQTATTQGASNYTWLYDYTNNCKSYGCNIEDSSVYGYWTSTPVKNESTYSWLVLYSGSLVRHNKNDSIRGVRPVITIQK